MLKTTISRVFMVKTLGFNIEVLEKHGFINSFLRDPSAGIENKKDFIILAFRPSNETEFQQFVNSETRRTQSLIRHYSYPCGIKMLVYKLDSKHSADFELVRQGKYSKTSKEYQALFPKTVKIKDIFGIEKEQFSLQYRVFNKTADLRKFWEDRLEVQFSEDQELWPVMSMEKETFNVNRFLVAEAG